MEYSGTIAQGYSTRPIQLVATPEDENATITFGVGNYYPTEKPLAPSCIDGNVLTFGTETEPGVIPVTGLTPPFFVLVKVTAEGSEGHTYRVNVSL